MTRPDYWDYKYKNLDVQTRKRESERDALLYDIRESQKPKVTSYYIPHKKTLNEYINDVDKIIEKDEQEEITKMEKHKVESKTYIDILKERYAKLAMEKDNTEQQINTTLGMSEYVGYIWILGILFIIVGLSLLHDSGIYMVMISISSCIIITTLSIINRKVKNKKLNKKLNKIIAEQKEIRKEIRQG